MCVGVCNSWSGSSSLGSVIAWLKKIEVITFSDLRLGLGGSGG